MHVHRGTKMGGYNSPGDAMFSGFYALSSALMMTAAWRWTHDECVPTAGCSVWTSTRRSWQ